MDIKQLRLFTSLCRNLHFGNAGLENHMSPSAVSRTIQRLEDSIGHRLFIRDNRSVELTEQGEMFHRYAMDVLVRFDALNQELGQTEGKLTGRLTLFASVTASQSILPRVLARFRTDYPDIHIQLETGYAVVARREQSTHVSLGAGEHQLRSFDRRCFLESVSAGADSTSP